MPTAECTPSVVASESAKRGRSKARSASNASALPSSTGATVAVKDQGRAARSCTFHDGVASSSSPVRETSAAGCACAQACVVKRQSTSTPRIEIALGVHGRSQHFPKRGFCTENARTAREESGASHQSARAKGARRLRFGESEGKACEDLERIL